MADTSNSDLEKANNYCSEQNYSLYTHSFSKKEGANT